MIDTRNEIGDGSTHPHSRPRRRRSFALQRPVLGPRDREPVRKLALQHTQTESTPAPRASRLPIAAGPQEPHWCLPVAHCPPRRDGRRVRAKSTRDAHAFNCKSKLLLSLFCFGGGGRAALAGGRLRARVALADIDAWGEAGGPRACNAVPAMELEEPEPTLLLLGALAFGVAAAGLAATVQRIPI